MFTCCGKPFSELVQKGFNPKNNEGNKVLGSSGFDATQMRDQDGNLKSVKDTQGKYTIPKPKYPINIVIKKQCPPAIKHRYYYEKRFTTV